MAEPETAQEQAATLLRPIFAATDALDAATEGVHNALPRVGGALVALLSHEPCQGAEEPHEHHLTYCVPFYEARQAALEQVVSPAGVATVASPWSVTAQRKVHLRACPVARRVSEPMSWLPSVKTAKDNACITCLWGVLPTSCCEDALRVTPPAGGGE